MSIPFIPNVSVIAYETELLLKFEIPGINSADVTVINDGRMLSISGQRIDRISETKCKHFRREIQYGPFADQLEMPPGCDVNSASAAYLNGFLKIRVPRSRDVLTPEKLKRGFSRLDAIHEGALNALGKQGTRPGASTVSQADSTSAQNRVQWSPNVNAYATDTHWNLSVELAGMSSDSLSVTHQERNLIISGFRPGETQSPAPQILLDEIPSGSFEVVIETPSVFDLTECRSIYANGFLLISFSWK